MEVKFFHKNSTDEENKNFQEYFEKKLESIKNFTTKFESVDPILKATLEKFAKHDAYEVELQLILPSKTIVAKEASHSIQKALDLSKDRLITQIKKHIAMLRKDREHQSIKEAMLKETEKIEG